MPAVDRKTRYVSTRKKKNTTEMKRTILEISKEINEILSCESYFCRPYCNQDKWQVENRNIDDFSLINDLISDGDSRGNYKQSSDETIRMENSS